ncbi:MAG: VWA domain-containing protein, partial [Vicinamibacterales bacterium]
PESGSTLVLTRRGLLAETLAGQPDERTGPGKPFASARSVLSQATPMPGSHAPVLLGLIATRRAWAALLTLFVSVGVLHGQQTSPATPADDETFRFRSGIELINVAATVYDRDGRFVPGLTEEDFTIYEDGRPQVITHFSAERVPVSLGIVLDTSGSMVGEKIQSARSALDRFLHDLLDEDDEVFLYRFSDDPLLLQDWTRDRGLISRALERIAPNGGTALFDAVSAAIPLAQAGTRRKKALLIISDGNDTSSRSIIRDVREQIRQSEVLVYAIGIDGDESPFPRAIPPRHPFPPIRRPFPPRPGGRGGWPRPPFQSPGLAPAGQIVIPRGQPRFPGRMQGDMRVNAAALRELTDDSGGRTEIIRGPRDLDPATAGIADELSRQYFLGYPASGIRDGKYHSIRVEVKGRPYQVRARRGYVAN